MHVTDRSRSMTGADRGWTSDVDLSSGIFSDAESRETGLEFH
jgi:hypothetical protein